MAVDRGARRVLVHVLTALACLAGIWLVNVSPGWRSFGFLTDEFAEIVGPLNVALTVGVLTRLAYFSRRTALQGFGDAAAATLALVVLAKLFVVFPFPLETGSGKWVVRVALGLGMVGAFVWLVAGLGRVSRRIHVRTGLRR